MLHEFSATLSQVCHAAGLLIILYGAFMLIGALATRGSPLAGAKGVAFILLGTWFSGLAG